MVNCKYIEIIELKFIFYGMIEYCDEDNMCRFLLFIKFVILEHGS